MNLTKEEQLDLARKLRKSNRFPFQPDNEYGEYSRCVDRETVYIPTREGVCTVYLCKSKRIIENPPVHIFLHGGGFVIEHGERDDSCVAKYATKIGGIVFDIDYNLAPENKFPVAFHQSYDVTKWLFDNLDAFGGEKDRVTMSGYSAGGNLTACVAMKANETSDFRLQKIFICYPPLDLATDPAQKKLESDVLIHSERARLFNSMYISEENDPYDPYISPLYASGDMLSGFPETTVITAGKDALKSEAHLFAQKLIDNNVKTTIRCFKDSRHGFMVNCKDEWEEAQQLVVNGILA